MNNFPLAAFNFFFQKIEGNTVAYDMRDQCGIDFYVPGEDLGDLFGEDMTPIPLRDHKPESSTNVHSAFAPRPVNDEEIERLKDDGKLVLDESENHINIQRLYYDKCRKSGEPSAYDNISNRRGRPFS